VAARASHLSMAACRVLRVMTAAIFNSLMRNGLERSGNWCGWQTGQLAPDKPAEVDHANIRPGLLCTVWFRHSLLA